MDELAAKYAAENFDRQEEAKRWMNPVLAVRRQATGRNHTVNVRMMEKILSPGVEHAKKTDVGSKVFWIGRNFQQSRSTGAEQQTIESLFVVEHQWRQLMRQREDHMHIGNR